MYSGGQFDAASAFSGGGFVTSQSTQLGDAAPAQTRSRESQGLIPLTAKQISETSQSGNEKSNFVINGVDVTNVTMVGMVFDKTERTTDVNFVLDDGTGRIGCKRWVNEAFDTREMEAIQNEMYVRVYGHLKSFQGSRQLVAFSVRPVTNFDEISFHFIDCIHNHLQSKLRLEGTASAQSSSIESSVNAPVRHASSGYQAPSNSSLAQFSMDQPTDTNQLVLDYLERHSDLSDDRGVHVDDLTRGLKLPSEKIMLCLKTLVDEGLVYSTIDDFHYKQA